MKSVRFRILLFAPFCLLLLSQNFLPFGKKKKNDGWVYAYFTGEGGTGLHMAWSQDGLKWTPLKAGKSFVKPGVGDYVILDPHLSRTPDGIYHLVWSPGPYRRDVGYAWSRNLIEWSAQRLIPVMENDSLAVTVRGPELIYDTDRAQFMLYWASTVPGKFPETARQLDSLPSGLRLNHRIYRRTSSDLRDWSPSELFFEPGFSVTDAHIAEDSGRFRLFYKDATMLGKNIQNNIKMGTGSSATGTFSTTPQLVSRRVWAEAPAGLRVDSQYVVYFHKYKARKMGAFATRDFQRWKDISDSLSFPRGMRHGNPVRVPEKILEKLKEL